MADSKDVDSLSSELESRLDDIFGESDGALPGFEDKDPAVHYPLAELKNLILSIDWEITDDVLEQFIQQIKDLKLTYQQDKIVSAFLQILNSLGIYIKTNRAKSHPKTFKILNAVFSSLDKVVLDRHMTETAKKKILLAEMRRYKELRTRIAQGKTAVGTKPKAKIAEAEPPLILEEAVSAETAQDRATTVTKPAAQPPDTAAGTKPKAKIAEAEPPLILEEAVSAETPRDRAATDTGPAAQPPDTGISEPTVTDQGQEPGAVAGGQAGVATLTEAVEEIKKYIHDQISALSKEIEALRKH